MNRLHITLAGLALSLFASLAPAAPLVEPLDRATARALGDSQQHEVPTLVALWSLSCPYCRKNLQEFQALESQGIGLRLVSVASEPLEDQHAEVLAQLGLSGTHYAYGDSAAEALAYALDPNWRGELPRTLLFDGKGGHLALSGPVSAERALAGLGLTPPTTP